MPYLPAWVGKVLAIILLKFLDYLRNITSKNKQNAQETLFFLRVLLVFSSFSMSKFAKRFCALSNFLEISALPSRLANSGLMVNKGSLRYFSFMSRMASCRSMAVCLGSFSCFRDFKNYTKIQKTFQKHTPFKSFFVEMVRVGAT